VGFACVYVCVCVSIFTGFFLFFFKGGKGMIVLVFGLGFL